MAAQQATNALRAVMVVDEEFSPRAAWIRGFADRALAALRGQNFRILIDCNSVGAFDVVPAPIGLEPVWVRVLIPSNSRPRKFWVFASPLSRPRSKARPANGRVLPDSLPAAVITGKRRHQPHLARAAAWAISRRCSGNSYQRPGPLDELHPLHAATQFLNDVFPPLETGFLWSTVNRKGSLLKSSAPRFNFDLHQ